MFSVSKELISRTKHMLYKHNKCKELEKKIKYLVVNIDSQ